MPLPTDSLSQPTDTTAAPGASFDSFMQELHNQSQLTPQDTKTLQANDKSTTSSSTGDKHLPPLVVHDDQHPQNKPQQPQDNTHQQPQDKTPKEPLGSMTNWTLNTVVGTAAVLGAEALTTYLFKNPEIGAEGASTAMTLMKNYGPMAFKYATAVTGATIARHYSHELLSGKDEDWMVSYKQGAIGVGTFATARRLGTALERLTTK